jgi:glycosyltransferase involved in cell wall biosynthesis
LIRAVGLRTAAFEPDLIHANGTRSGLVLPRNICRAAPAIVHARDLREPVYVTRVAAARAAAVVAISDTVARQWQARVPGSPPVLRVYNGVDVGPRSTMPRSRSESSVIGLVADMVPWKRHRLFLQVLAELRRRGRPVRGLVVGRPLTGRGVRYLAELKGFSVQLGVADAVEFVTDAEEALPHIERMDVLLSTAEQEPFGRTVVEALALGRPVVAVRGAGPEEILAGCGAGRCAGPDAGPLARAVSELLGQAPEELAQMARKRAADFATERMVQEMADLYRRLHRAGGAPEGVLR